jgi:hypothetical protein
MNHRVSVVVLLLSPLVTGIACASDVIKVNPVVPYANIKVGSLEMRRDCDWDRKIVDYLVVYSKGSVEVSEEDLTNDQGKVLKLEIKNVHAIGGGGFSGPKWGYIDATLMDQGKVVSTFEVGSKTTGRGWTACAVLERIAKQIGARTAKMLRKPPRAQTTSTDEQAVEAAEVPSEQSQETTDQ